MSYNPIASTIKIGNHKFPGIWQYILPEEFMWLKLPNESFTVCNKCHRVETQNYRSDCRCCTYFPQIPNFLLGLALKDPTSEPLVKKVIENEVDYMIKGSDEVSLAMLSDLKWKSKIRNFFSYYLLLLVASISINFIKTGRLLKDITYSKIIIIMLIIFLVLLVCFFLFFI